MNPILRLHKTAGKEEFLAVSEAKVNLKSGGKINENENSLKTNAESIA